MISTKENTGQAIAVLNQGLLRDCRVRTRDEGDDATRVTAADRRRYIDNPGLRRAPFWNRRSHSRDRLRGMIASEIAVYAGRYLPELTGLTPAFEGWVNWYPKGEFVPRHDHGTTHVVVTYYPLGNGVLIFPDHDMRVSTAPGLMVLFPGRYAHYSEPNRHDEFRVVVTTNVNFRSGRGPAPPTAPA